MIRRPILASALVLSVIAVPLGAFADPVDTDTARSLLFLDERPEVVRYDTTGLTEQEIATLVQVAQTQKYYAALAFAPADGIMAEPTVMSANYHSIEAARDAALSGCNERRSGGASCVIAMEVRPRGWEARALQLSADATTGFEDTYRQERGARAFAISASSGLWGIGLGVNAQENAISACQGDTNVADCAIVIVD
ncbi:5-aminolevulic acid synthase [Pararhodobacter sp.]|uniref:5-aminolevulic acid synthase n=1 Tax=Pararhodobacter sp. TaxID=2127056 RepID=UPI002AFEA5E4|nr:5-aminolevulic acid synthase [Pararhodobacter sp.]